MKSENSFSPVCSVGGKIEKLLLFHTCSGSERPEQAWEHFTGLIETLGSEVDYYILTQLPVNRQEKTLPSPAPHIHLIPDASRAPQDFPLTRWVQDISHAFTRNPGEYKLLFDTARVKPETLESLGRHIPGLRVSPLGEQHLSGGNFFVCREQGGYLLAGADLLNWELRGIERKARPAVRAAFEQRLLRLFGVKKIYWLNLTPASGRMRKGQPLFHLDLYVTPAGPVSDHETDRSLMLVGEVKTDYVFGTWNKNVRELQQALDRTAEWLGNDRAHRGLKCRVVRVPLLVFDTRTEHYGCYNNGLVEYKNNRNNFYLPDFTPQVAADKKDKANARRIARIQKELQTSLRKAGAGTVKFVPGDFFGLSRKKGSLRCMVKVIQRSAA